MELLEYLRSNKNPLEKISQDYNIICRRDKKYSNLVQLSYHQFLSPMSEALCRQCRGIILDECNDWNIVCRTYDRFANYGDSWGQGIDWPSVKFFEKSDGTLIQMYHYNGEWRVATTGSTDAGGLVPETKISLNDFFWETWGKLGYETPGLKNYCFAFELVGPQNRLVVFYEDSNILFHGARCLDNMKQYGPCLAEQFGWNKVKSYNFNNITDCLNDLDSVNGFNFEGYVACDKYFNRLKLKAKDYIKKHRAFTVYSVKSLIELVIAGESEEVREYLKDHGPLKKKYIEVKSNIDKLCSMVDTEFDKVKHISDRKEFARQVKNSKFSSILFILFNGQVKNSFEALTKLKANKIKELLTE